MKTDDIPLLEVKNLKTYIPTSKGEIKPVGGVSFSIKKGEIVALVGESGKWKKCFLPLNYGA